MTRQKHTVKCCNNKQRYNEDKCKCQCKKLIDKGICDKGFIWNRGNLIILWLGHRQLKCFSSSFSSASMSMRHAIIDYVFIIYILRRKEFVNR